MSDKEINKRATFAIISHPDAGKTTLTEKFLLFGGAIQLAGTVKGRKASRHATSDWMAIEQERGISVTTSVLCFPYKNRLFNLLDTPGHADFSEDTYRTLSAVDSALMVIDAAKGVEPRTIELMKVCRMRATPIMTFINKFDRETRDPIELLDEVESILNIQCTPITWPIGHGREFQGIYHLLKDKVYLFPKQEREKIPTCQVIEGLNNSELDKQIGDLANLLREDIELVQGASHAFEQSQFLKGKQTPVYIGSALNNLGVQALLDDFVDFAPSPQPRKTQNREVLPTESQFSGVVFKIQANMDPKHRDRVAFLRVCSGKYEKGKKLFHVRANKSWQSAQVHTFLAGERGPVEQAYPGDILGLYNRGGIQIGDSFTEGEKLTFFGVPNFAPLHFRAVRPKDPLKMKALNKGLDQLSEEGATQVFRPILDNRIILGAVGILQFDVVAHRLHYEYQADCVYEPIQVATARWVECADHTILKQFEQKAKANLALDGGQCLTYLAPSRVNLTLTEERFPEINFRQTREQV